MPTFKKIPLYEYQFINLENYMTNTNSENKELLKAKLTESLLPFILKTSVVFFFIAATIFTVVPKYRETERNKLILISFIQNPYVLWELSLIEERGGNNAKAVVYLEAAIGLLEMNGATEKALLKYQNKLNTLKK
jgi:hypothetical protein